jgi:hypothetical protein
MASERAASGFVQTQEVVMELGFSDISRLD